MRQLSAALQAQGLESFKSWPGTSTWFYPVYGSGFSNATIKTTFDHARTVNPKAREAWTAGALNGSLEARHVETEPTSFLELGEGFGTLGEIVMRRNAAARYVNLDLPPLLTVAAYYLVPDVVGPFDVFMNAYSFQEIEPDVVDHYIQAVADMGVRYAVSYNSVHGKPKKILGPEGSALDPVTSARIIDMFQRRGYRLLHTYRDPLVVSAAEIAVLERS